MNMGITLKYSLLYYLFKEKLRKLFKIGEKEKARGVM